MEENNGLPLGICRQAVLKLDSALNDINEIKEDECTNDEQRYVLDVLSETVGRVMSTIVNMVSQEMNEEEFLGEQIPIDHISMNEDGSYPEEEMDLMDQEI